jgi:hypothetical protein
MRQQTRLREHVLEPCEVIPEIIGQLLGIDAADHFRFIDYQWDEKTEKPEKYPYDQDQCQGNIEGMRQFEFFDPDLVQQFNQGIPDDGDNAGNNDKNHNITEIPHKKPSGKGKNNKEKEFVLMVKFPHVASLF